jgi:hypothetical protein
MALRERSSQRPPSATTLHSMATTERLLMRAQPLNSFDVFSMGMTAAPRRLPPLLKLRLLARFAAKL